MKSKALDSALTVWRFVRARIGPITSDSSALYGKVSSTEADLASQETLFEYEEGSNDRTSFASGLYKGCIWSTKAAFLVSYVWLAYLVFVTKGPIQCVLGNEGRWHYPDRSP